MYGDPVAVFFQSVKPAFRAYAKAREESVSGSHSHLSTATTAANELFHFREHIPGNSQKTRSQVEADCPAYRLIADVSNAAKHQKINRNQPLVASANDMRETYVITSYTGESGKYTDARTTIEVNCTDGTVRNLDTALVEVYNYWSSQLAKLGLPHDQPLTAFIEPGSNFVPRNSARSGAFSVMGDVGWKQRVKLMIFDNGAGRSTPLDLTPYEIQLRVYEPKPMILDVFMRADQLAEPLKASVELTLEETTEYNSLRTTPEREAFQQRISVKYKNVLADQFNSQLAAAGFTTRLASDMR